MPAKKSTAKVVEPAPEPEPQPEPPTPDEPKHDPFAPTGLTIEERMEAMRLDQERMRNGG